MAAPLKQRRAWSDDDVASMIRMREQGKTWREIDAAMGRTQGGSQLKYAASKAPSKLSAGSIGGGRVELSAEQAANLRARKDAENRMSLTATLFGDPPPGYSALDRRGQ
jgi:hypothetical protein